jgi:hypothetical protein
MFTSDAAYFRKRRQAEDIPERDSFCAPKFLQQVSELQGPKQLPWPMNLFGELASIAELMAESAHANQGSSSGGGEGAASLSPDGPT